MQLSCHPRTPNLHGENSSLLTQLEIIFLSQELQVSAMQRARFSGSFLKSDCIICLIQPKMKIQGEGNWGCRKHHLGLGNSLIGLAWNLHAGGPSSSPATMQSLKHHWKWLVTEQRVGPEHYQLRPQNKHQTRKYQLSPEGNRDTMTGRGA